MTPSQFAREVLQLNLQPWQVELLGRLDRGAPRESAESLADKLLDQSPETRASFIRYGNDVDAVRFGRDLLREHGRRHDEWASHHGSVAYYKNPDVLGRQPDGSFAFREYARHDVRDEAAYRHNIAGGQATARGPVGIPWNNMADVMVARPRVPGGLGS